MKLNMKSLLITFSVICIVKGSDELNGELSASNDEIFRNLVRPFRMEKLNLIWVKAQQVNTNNTQRLL